MWGVMRYVVGFAFLFCSLGCGGGSSVLSPPPVQASSGFSNSNLNGTYAYSGNGVGAGNLAESAVGVVTADGKGNISAGESTANIGGTICHLTSISGTYSVNSDGTGTASITGTLDPQSISNGCASGQSTLFLAIANGGNTVLLVNQSQNAVISYVGIKQ